MHYKHFLSKLQMTVTTGLIRNEECKQGPSGDDKGGSQHFFSISINRLFYILDKSTEPPQKNLAQRDHKKGKENLNGS